MCGTGTIKIDYRRITLLHTSRIASFIRETQNCVFLPGKAVLAALLKQSPRKVIIRVLKTNSDWGNCDQLGKRDFIVLYTAKLACFTVLLNVVYGPHYVDGLALFRIREITSFSFSSRFLPCAFVRHRRREQ